MGTGKHRAARSSKGRLTGAVSSVVEMLEPRRLLTALYWDPNGTDAGIGGAGTWNPDSPCWATASDGSGVHIEWQEEATAVFAGTGGVITLDEDMSTPKLVFQSSGYKLGGNYYVHDWDSNQLTIAAEQFSDPKISVMLMQTVNLEGDGAVIFTRDTSRGIHGAPSLVVGDGVLCRFASNQTLATLTLQSGGNALINQGGTKLLMLNDLSFEEDANGAPLAQLDITDNVVDLHPGGTTPYSDIRDWIASGRGVDPATALPTWGGLGIMSSTAAEDFLHAVGYYDDSGLLPTQPKITRIFNRGIGSYNNDLLFRFTGGADYNIDGVVNNVDVSILNLQYDNGVSTGHQWFGADSTFDGLVDDADVAVLNSSYNPAPDAPVFAIDGLDDPWFNLGDEIELSPRVLPNAAGKINPVPLNYRFKWSISGALTATGTGSDGFAKAASAGVSSVVLQVSSDNGATYATAATREVYTGLPRASIPVGSIDVSAEADRTQAPASSIFLEGGASYFAVASGTYTISHPTEQNPTASTRYADAKYWQNEDGSVGYYNGQLKLTDADPNVTWDGATPGGSFVFMASHAYTAEFTGTDEYLKAWISDVNYPDNLGGLHLDIYKVLSANLAASTISHNAATGELGEDKEESVGAFLPVNDDDDDYTAVPGGANGEDYKQSGAVLGENDLLPVVLHAVDYAPSGSVYQLGIPKGFNVYLNSNRTSPADANTTLTISGDTTVYVEAQQKTTGTLSLHLTTPTKTYLAVDKVKLTAFQWAGPLNVPGHTIYEYTTKGAPPGGKWLDPVGGELLNVLGAELADIRWGAGPVVGSAVFEATSSFIWNLEVNVVEVSLAPVEGKQINFNNPARQDQNNWVTIESFNDGSVTPKAIIAGLTVQKIDGPTAQHRGLKFIDVGFIQNVRITSAHADYDSVPRADGKGNGVRRVANLETTQYYADTDATDMPWYHRAAAVYVAPSNTPIANRALEFWDEPQTPANDTQGFGGQLYANRYIILDEFDLYLAVHTKQAVNGSDKVYTQMAATNWTFNGSGNVNQQTGIWTSIPAQNNTGPDRFSYVTDGTIVPVTEGEGQVDRNKTLKFTTRDQ